MAEKRTTKVGFPGDIRSIEVTVPEGEPAIWDADAKFRLVGTSIPRVDGVAKATGRAAYTADTQPAGMLHARMLRAASPGGTLRSLDLAAAEKVRGVRLAKPLAAPGLRILMEGQDLAFLVADDEAALDAALAACRVAIEPGPFHPDEASAMTDGAAVIHPDSDSNIRRGGRRGRPAPDPTPQFEAAEEAMADADAVVEAVYVTHVQTHSPLETHGCVAVPDGDGGLDVYASTQGTFSVMGGLAQALGLPRGKVRVITEYMGGGFGAKFGPSSQGSGWGIETARAALELGKPVRCMLTRREEHLVAGNRPSSTQAVKLGVKKDGKVLGYTVRAFGTAGIAEGGAGVSNPMIYALGRTAKEEFTVVTSAGPAAAFRAPGHPQGSFALEQALDEAAEAIGMDPLDLRLTLDSHPVRRAQMQDGAERFGWRAARKRRRDTGPVKRGVGMGSAVWYQAGGNRSEVTVTVHRDGAVEVSNGAQDIGTGTRTLLAVIVAEVLGLEVADVKVNLGRTDWPSGPGSGGSTTAPTLGPCARDAAEKAKAAVLGDAPAKGGAAWRAACARIDGESRTFSGRRPATYGQYHRQVGGCQFAEVEVDTDTGVVRVVRMLALQDCGRVIDRLTAESQVIGGVINGISYALFEERILDRGTGRLLHGDLEGYRIAGAKDVPDIQAHLWDVANAGNNTGMMGLGEPPKVPTAGTIANAVAHAIGVRVREIPLTPARVIAALEREGR